MNKKIVLLRHGQSTWNLENRFTGWTDVDLTAQGTQEARQAGKILKDEGFLFNITYTSYLKRAIKALRGFTGTQQTGDRPKIWGRTSKEVAQKLYNPAAGFTTGRPAGPYA